MSAPEDDRADDAPEQEPVAYDPVIHPPEQKPDEDGSDANPVAETEIPYDRDQAFMSGSHRQPGWNRPDPFERPRDPAGSFPRFDPKSLLPTDPEPLVIENALAFTPGQPKPRIAAEPVAVAAAATSDGGGARIAADDAPQSSRFQFVTGALVALAAAGVLLLALVVTKGDDSATTQTITIGPKWSAWAPTAGNGDGATQIAEHVGQEYKAADGRQLVAVTGGPLEVAGLPLTVAIRNAPAQGGKISLQEGQGVLYRMCGLGEKCSIPTGKPSVARHLLLRREALELALYSFRYLKDVNQVVVFMPPRQGQDPSQALFFKPQDVAAELNQPLAATLAGKTPSVSTMRSSQNAKLVDSITGQSLFQFSLTQANQDARAFLVLDPFQNP